MTLYIILSSESSPSWFLVKSTSLDASPFKTNLWSWRDSLFAWCCSKMTESLLPWQPSVQTMCCRNIPVFTLNQSSEWKDHEGRVMMAEEIYSPLTFDVTSVTSSRFWVLGECRSSSTTTQDKTTLFVRHYSHIMFFTELEHKIKPSKTLKAWKD